MSAIFRYATGLDRTRRDLQLQARAKQLSWNLGKNFEHSAAVMGAIIPAARVPRNRPRRIALEVDGAVEQDAHLSKFYRLVPGDLIFTGTPAGVGPVVTGNSIAGTIDGLPDVSLWSVPQNDLSRLFPQLIRLALPDCIHSQADRAVFGLTQQLQPPATLV